MVEMYGGRYAVLQLQPPMIENPPIETELSARVIDQPRTHIGHGATLQSPAA